MAAIQRQYLFIIAYSHSGDDVELRCSVAYGKNAYYPYCMPHSDYANQSTYCNFKWTKDGAEFTNTSYSIETKISFGYCSDFNLTSLKMQNMTSMTESEWNRQTRYTSSDLECFTSILTISNVGDNDFGGYHCNFSYHSEIEHTTDRFYRYSISNISLVNAAEANNEMPKRKLFYQKSDMYLINMKFYVLQCVLTGTQKIYWNIFYCKHGGSNHGSCDYSRFKLDDPSSQDVWLGFYNISTQYNPYEDVVESILIIKNVTATAGFEVSCSFEEEPVLNTSLTVSIWGPNTGGMDDIWYYVFYVVYTPTFCSLIFLIFIGFVIAACCRAKVCGSHR